MALEPLKVPSDLPLGELQKEVHDWISKHGVRYFNELTNISLALQINKKREKLVAFDPNA